MSDTRDTLRSSLREKRQELSPEQQETAAVSLFSMLGNQDFFRVAQRIAFYQVADGEIDPRMLLDLALSEGKSCFLPVIQQDNPEFVSFAPYDANTELVPNKWGIAEPPATEVISPTNFDVVFVPLVGFSKNCFRLGMGKGFYDRTFSFKIFNRRSSPMLVGLAHESQLVDSFPVESWDVRLDAVATEKKIYRPDIT
ncbi:MAG: 5-formyltetrahydrofolate cyclo-ligase [Proteobacteria bacterium]|jgi:5-formyltetrahydrofolate cyclo-ligase|nr:5-formyltetrahydrofolate cyclo-ligase [Pseudomonadota bacterium]MDA1289977.1 5-formyltetrahydrofolate cyclo-ligase [Pseudomonadota bacterium]